MTNSRYVTVRQAAELLGRSETKVLKQAKSQEIPSEKVGGGLKPRYMILRTDVEAILAREAAEVQKRIEDAKAAAEAAKASA